YAQPTPVPLISTGYEKVQSPTSPPFAPLMKAPASTHTRATARNEPPEKIPKATMLKNAITKATVNVRKGLYVSIRRPITRHATKAPRCMHAYPMLYCMGEAPLWRRNVGAHASSIHRK